MKQDDDKFENEKIEMLDIVDYSAGKIFPEKKDWGINRLHSNYKKGKLVLQPNFQREFVWDKRKSSRLIESIILGFPIPLIFLAEEEDNRQIVIDGQQRLQSLFSFIDGKFPDNSRFRLSGVFKEINNKFFSELKEVYQDKIFDYSISSILFRKESDPDIKFNVFERLNRGSVSLNAQEIRNCVHRGKYNETLKQLSQNKDFKYILGFTNKPHARMKDVELVLKFAAFYHQTYLKYTTSKKFLNDEMMDNRDVSDEKANKLEIAFKNSVSIIKSIFGKGAFVRFMIGDNNEINGGWDNKLKNVALYEVLMYSFADISHNLVQQHLDLIREALIYLMSREDFRDSITTRTNNRLTVQYRFATWITILNKIIDISYKEPRCFSYSLKEKLFNENRICSICSQKIQVIDDAELDHIVQYWLCGKTIPENARLVHRYCNRSRSKYDTEKGIEITDSKKKETVVEAEFSIVDNILREKNINIISTNTNRTRPTGFKFLEEFYTTSNWKDLLLQFTGIIFNKHKEDFEKASSIKGIKRPYFSKDEMKMNRPVSIGSSMYYTETCLNSRDIRKNCYKLLNLFNYEESDLIIIYS